jgi:DNA-binding XRE family transcriptional regulator
MEPQDRLQKARQEAGYENAVDAARAFGWGQSTYISHENGTRGLKPTIAEKYARAFRVTPEWLLYGNKGKKAQALAAERRTVPLVGYVGAGATATSSAIKASSAMSPPLKGPRTKPWPSRYAAIASAPSSIAGWSFTTTSTGQSPRTRSAGCASSGFSTGGSDQEDPAQPGQTRSIPPSLQYRGPDP